MSNIIEYSFKTKPYKHQEEVFRDSWSERMYALFMEMERNA